MIQPPYIGVGDGSWRDHSSDPRGAAGDIEAESRVLREFSIFSPVCAVPYSEVMNDTIGRRELIADLSATLGALILNCGRKDASKTVVSGDVTQLDLSEASGALRFERRTNDLFLRQETLRGSNCI
ncbi:MAG: hypothetical protein DYH05_04365 [Acidobacteria bacterium ACB1]|nr:hypothetical protein [Acidobacteria bacterium ACB1]RIJ95240.1 MAG: hypothetical protein DCC44_02600 [Acidobacteriota bacterium]